MNLPEFLKTEGLQAAFYGRYSTDSQNVETQRFVCNEFAEKNGITIINEYVDENKSAFKKTLDQREYLDLLRKDARERKFDCVLVYKADRLARRIDQHMQLWGEFRELGIPIILTESEKLYTTDSPTEIMVEIGLSSLEAENTRIRTRDHYNSRTARGEWVGGKLPYGFQYERDEEDNSIMVPIPHQTDNVKRIFKFYKRGYGFKRIADIMNEKHPKDTFGKWVAEGIKSIITNPYYAGYTTSQRIVPGSGSSVQDRSEWKIGKCDKIPAIITEEEWNECMEIYEGKKKGKVTKSKYITPYLFIDILQCKTCEQKVIGKNYTPGKRKKDGSKYEDKMFYICKGCKQKWDINKVHEYLFNEILGGWHYQFHSKQKEKLQSNIMVKIKQEILEIEESINNFKKELFKYKDKLKEVEIKQKALMEKNPEPDDLQHALVQYRISVQKKIDLYEDEIQKKEKEKQQLYLSYGDVKNFKEITKQITDFEYGFSEPEFRKLVLFLLDKVTISGKEEYEYEITAKVDLSERGTIILGRI